MDDKRRRTGHTQTQLVKNSAPPWMRFHAPPSVPNCCYGLVTSYFLAVQVALEKDPPRKVLVRIRDRGDGLVFQVLISSEKDRSAEGRALTTVARHYSEMSTLLLSARARESCDLLAGRDQPDREHKIRALAQRELFDHPSVGESGTAAETGRVEREVEVFSWSKHSAVDGGRNQGRDADTADRIRRAFARLVATGPTRPLRLPPENFEGMVDQLVADFPNFASVIRTVIKPHLALLAKGYRHRLNSLILVGPPGVGKTYFATKLAAVLGVGAPMFVSMATETNNASLSGSSTFWSNSAPGALFERLAWGSLTQRAVANPLVVLDEIDKVSGDHRYDPLGPLYSLLECETARNFQDQSMPDVVIDASNVRFVATANDLRLIPEPLLSRALVFQIDPPSRAQLKAVIETIYRDLIRQLGVPMRDGLPSTVVERALSMSPRAAKVRLECAIAAAVSDGRDSVDPGDWPEISADAESRTRNRMGFMG